MVRTLVIGDLHFDNKPPGLLEAQVEAVKKIFTSAQTSYLDSVVFLGDLMMHRKPYPRVLLALKEVIDFISPQVNKVYILRGNHDSENKSDDEVTALSLLESYKVDVITRCYCDNFLKYYFIPHYEDEETIRKLLAEAPQDYMVFGHFGYRGSLNSVGDADFGINISEFSSPTILGHLHHYGRTDSVTLLGTPYTTNYTEYKKENYYAIVDSKHEIKTYPIDWGPRHLIMDQDLVEENLDWINDPIYFTMLRINLSTLKEDREKITDLIDQLEVGYVEVKFKPVFDDRCEQSDYDPINPVVEISEDLIEKYINASSTQISKDKLLEGLQLIHENQQDRN
jgi:DNA repair exonuclease SbcCD nuclease subunit|tara:strand:- start:731 stop:1747 length:1017 start_codon:yes stop_codon:yes gene_type:complete